MTCATLNHSAVCFCLRLLTLATVLLAGCARLPPEPLPTAQDQILNRLEQWQLEGKLGYRSPEDSGSAFVHWQQKPDAFQVTLTGPFGAGATRIQADVTGAVLRRAGSEDIRAASAAELTTWLFGWQWPIDQMRYWIKGLPAPEPRAVRTERDANGRLVHLEQAGWTLAFDRYALFEQWLLPGRVKGRYGDISFTLIIKNWSAEANTASWP